MTSYYWEAIDSFHSYSEYERFQTWIFSQLNEGSIEELPVMAYYISAQLNEKWFKCKDNKEVWRLVPPDPPFKGFWGPVS